MKAVILAAGRGTRLGSLTKTSPKCLLSIEDTNILSIQVKLFLKNNIKEIYVVTGFCEEKIKSENIIKINNIKYKDTNMVYSLMQVMPDIINDDVIISYGDIIFTNSVLRSLLENKDSNLIVSDTNWKDYWLTRYNTTNFDIESFKVKNKKILDIGKECKDDTDIDGRYVGLMKFNTAALSHMNKIWKRDIGKNDNHWLTYPRSLEQSYMTDMIQQLIIEGLVIKTHEINNNWCEIDTTDDYIIAQEFYKNNKDKINF
ncbi:MAG: phosphocholine cytidylyltransferase family protein [Gammaproteobacteria bacterium]|jgi:L-glutamine-phosphate cytidylyltransferase|nr:phosphocholine cytidylyltransferase family protein [Gammaproteobacteria bacterium]MBT4462025.1 phosphocholine cytidylyltransferase family protein [Gammaproteobacteria bacterium]MBT4654537.1 phosphocholine cytidylyltransferase family protein [Gammaproteobacteria bacterium]MBT5117149.1 phosphocholine cytidylyltransferase family protein [Gammaproteobacteria bacterium]MBT5761478.1 phosphocholine cytidylyltransferase family protein [Gammaproteobacteria bacterium]